jgi:hypothetical protein
MSEPSRFMGSVGRQARSPDTGPGQSSSGVVVELSGWRPGLRKVALTKLLREGGNNLADAAQMTGRVLDGKRVRVRLCRFKSVEAARVALTKLGIANVRA